MNKKLFIGATVITVTVIGGLVYYRHQVRQAMESLSDNELEDLSEEEFDVSFLGGGKPIQVVGPPRVEVHDETPE